MQSSIWQGHTYGHHSVPCHDKGLITQPAVPSAAGARMADVSMVLHHYIFSNPSQSTYLCRAFGQITFAITTIKEWLLRHSW